MSLSGRVIARDGAAVAGVVVEARGGHGVVRTTVGEDGRFTLEGVEHAPMFVRAHGSGQASRGAQYLQVADASGVELVVEHAYTISGRVVCGVAPVAGAHIVAVVSDHPTVSSFAMPMHVETDADGRFAIADAVSGSYRLAVSCQGYLRDPGREIEVTDRHVTEIVVELGAGATLSGRVEPPGEAQVGIAQDMRSEGLSIGARCGPDGAFTLRGVPHGACELRAMASDGASGTLEVQVDGDRAGLVIALAPRASIRGRVVDTAGVPVAGVLVTRFRRDVPVERRLIRAPIVHDATTAVDGTFELVGLDAGGLYRLVVDERNTHTEVEVSDAAHDELTITVPARDAAIRGRVVDVAGSPVLGAHVSVWHGRAGARTGADGAFTISGLRAGRYTLVVEGHEARTVTPEVATGDDVTLTLVPLGTLTIRVSPPTAEVALDCWGSPETFGLIAEKVTGEHTFERVTAGEYRCTATGASASASATVTVRGERASFELALEPHATVTGIAASILDGTPIPDVSVVTGRGFHGKTDAAGRFTLNAPAGDDKLTFIPREHLGYGTEEHPYRAAPGEHVDLGTVAIVPPRPASTAAGTYGVRVDATCTITRVRAGSPAAAAGLVTGDTIASIAGRAIADLGAERARRLVTSDSIGVGQTVTLGLARGTTVTLTAVAY